MDTAMNSEVECFLDVSDLEPPEPLVRALAEIDKLKTGQYLHMRHRREPCLLYPNLEQRGFAHLTRVSGLDFEVFIWRRDDSAAGQAACAAAREFMEG